ncbi:CheR family methyltransferase [Nocardioides houyundeii]|uniref:CheR family methyltransferase n=1 Tax=Nocardioides houyundeii TaxID=2045452 RepID=UPI000C78175F|nr:protein-glutamate O-methyltransferase CheR [Nocardioides houyundeii]
MSLSQQSFAYVGELVHRETAMVYALGKEYLVEARLLPLAVAAGQPDLDSYVSAVREDVTEQGKVVDALMINETSWFRDNKPFRALATGILPEIFARPEGPRRLNVWSAACSSGQEPYSIAMVLDQHLPRDWSADVWATDVSPTMVERVQAGRYSQVEVNRGLPATSLVDYFTREGSEWAVAQRLKEMVRPSRLNLAGQLPAMPRFDIVFLRNVLIYFDDETKQRVLDGVRDVISPNGYLVLGSSETSLDLGERWARETCGRIMLHRPAPRPRVHVPRPGLAGLTDHDLTAMGA